ncbi:MAG: divalent cation tolerance protein CutA, partial [Woeseiaceae bacterium]|nr:divalent cation tolerance protein CutA [Woeseiaceae bacterium]
MITGPTEQAPALVVLCTCPDEATATRIATELVATRLAACVTRVAGATATYRWKGRVE